MSNTMTPSDGTRLLLAGRPSLIDFVRTIKTSAVGASDLDEMELTREWRTAHALVKELQSNDASSADMHDLEGLPSTVSQDAETILERPEFQHKYGLVPYTWALVELDRLIVWQSYVDLPYVALLRERLGYRPSLRELVRFAAGESNDKPPVCVTGYGGNDYVITSPSSDLRVLSISQLDPKSFQDYNTGGRPAAMFGVYVGYSMNTLSAVHMSGRTILMNGTHRAYALRAHGLTHVPCMIRRPLSTEDLDLVGPGNADARFSTSFTAKRPPLLKDFFDPRLVKSYPAVRKTHQIEVKIRVEHSIVAI